MKHVLLRAWDEAAESLNGTPLIGQRVRYAAAIKPLLSLPKTACILEAGCGSGRILRALAGLGYQRLVGIEISHARLGKVKQLGPASAHLVCSSEVPFASQTFDAIVSSAVIEHVVDPSRWLAELARVARRGALVSIVTDTYMWHWLKSLGLYRSIQPVDEAIWPSTLIGWAARSGLKLVGCGGFNNTPDQRGYFIKQLLGLIPGTWRLRRWLRRPPVPAIPPDEKTAILEAIQDLPDGAGLSRWACVWSYECYYWFQKG
jgi:SAM-dependent methyltransferase